MRYAKLIDGDISFAPRALIVDGRQIGNPPASVYEAEGYKVVIFADDPGEAPDGFRWVERWSEDENSIQQFYVLEEVPITEEDALVRYINEQTGASDETLAEATETLIRQKMEV